MHFASRTKLPPNPIVGLSDKIAEISKRTGNFIPLQQGDLDFPTPPHIVEAASKALLDGYTKYAPASGYAELRYAIARKLREFNGIDCDPDHEILVTQGSNEALYVSLSSLLDPGDEAILVDPCYPPYDSLVRAAGAVPVHAASSEGNGWLPLIEDLEKSITPRTRVVLVNTPNNPTGELYPREYLEEIGDLASRHSLVLLSDEAYEALTYDGFRHVSPAAVPQLRGRTAAAFSFSKTYAMTGWRLGYLYGPREFIERASVMHNLVLAHVSSHIQIAGARALSESQSCVESIVKELDRRRQLLVRGLNRIEGVSCRAPKGTFYAFPKFDFQIPTEALARKLIERGVGTSPGPFFGYCGEGYLRLSFSKVDIAQIKEALKRIETVTTSLIR